MRATPLSSLIQELVVSIQSSAAGIQVRHEQFEIALARQAQRQREAEYLARLWGAVCPVRGDWQVRAERPTAALR